jgi:hypothetical protein
MGDVEEDATSPPPWRVHAAYPAAAATTLTAATIKTVSRKSPRPPERNRERGSQLIFSDCPFSASSPKG